MPYNGSSGDAGYGTGGSNYGYKSTSTGQGNWNTGGHSTGFGSMSNGIVGLGRNPSQYTVEPDGSNPNPMWGPMIDRMLGQHQPPRNGHATPTAGPPGMQPQPSIPTPRPNPFAKFAGPMADYFDGPPVGMDHGIIARMLQGLNAPQITPAGGGAPDPYSNYQTHYNGGGPGNSFGQRTSFSGGGGGAGFSGGGFGGGGGGGW